MNKHTPGPWVVYDDSNDGKTNRIEIAAWGKTVARIYHSVPAEDLPNARLIAAAPDLLEALKDTLQLLEVYCGDFEEATRKQARAAIAKAEGQK
jgi:predicted MarR family transcription regulator